MDSATGTFALEHLRVLAVVAGSIPCSGGRGPARAPGPPHPALPEPGVDRADSVRHAPARRARALVRRHDMMLVRRVPPDARARRRHDPPREDTMHAVIC